MYLKHDKNLLIITVCRRALRERYGPVSCSVYAKKCENNLFFRIFLPYLNKKLDRNAPLRSLVLRAEIDSFISCFIQKKAAGRPAGRPPGRGKSAKNGPKYH